MKIEKETIIEVKNIEVKFNKNNNSLFGKDNSIFKAVDKVSLKIHKGETLGLVGESGSGKSTLGRCMVGLQKINKGNILLNNIDINKLSKIELKKIKKYFQIMFQDPYSSLNPRKKVDFIIREPLLINKIGNKIDQNNLVKKLLKEVGLSKDDSNKFPHEFSGGQRQRIALARSIAIKPNFIVLDEPVSALDVSIQAQILNLLLNIQSKYNLTYLLITHDMGVVRNMSDRIAVMYLGQIVEITKSVNLFNNPLHPYTNILIDSIPAIEKKFIKRDLLVSEDQTQPLFVPNEGCRFQSRCPIVKTECKKIIPSLYKIKKDHFVACHYPQKLI